MVRINIQVFDKLFDNLKNYIQECDVYSATITKKPLKQNDKFPLIVITEEDNVNFSSDIHFTDTISKGYYEINIYTQNKMIDGAMHYDMEIAREYSAIVDNYMSRKLKAVRTYCSPTPNVDNSIYRITMRYEMLISDYRGRQLI